MLLSGLRLLAQYRLVPAEKSGRLPRDFLLPAPASNCTGCLRKELRYDIGFAMQTGFCLPSSSTTSSLSPEHQPHSGRLTQPGLSSQCHSSTGSAKGPERLPRRVERARQRQLHQGCSTDDYKSPETRHQGKPRHSRRPLCRGRNLQAV